MIQLLLASGTIALIISFVGYQMYRVRWLKDHGSQIIAMVTSVRHETGKTSWGFTQDNCYVTAKWTNPRTGRTYTFWTWIMNSYPGYSKGSLVPVVVDSNNPKHYTMDC